MSYLRRLLFLLRISDSSHIARRYFVTNGFDGALAMLGLVTGFRLSGNLDLETALWACIGTAVALATSGVSSAYVSESAEREKSLQELERAMAGESLSASAHARAAQLASFFVALVNGGAPLLLASFITLPIWLGARGANLGLPALDIATAVAFVEIGLLGAFLGKIANRHWFLMAVRTSLIAAATAAIIYLLGS
jgi:predicted membrane protein (TIGR00267 family)